jgi:geranylgeranyl diphosphate synthase, type II
MHSFEQLSHKFNEYFSVRHFPVIPPTLYDPAEYFLNLGGKRLRPVLCLMGNELFGELHPDVYKVATAIELFHNFTLIHDDIMDKAPLRRGKATVHEKFGEPTALLAGDVMLVKCYDYISDIDPRYMQSVLKLFNQTACGVCEGQQHDMDFEKQEYVGLPAYVEMITLKTSVLLAGSVSMGAIMADAGSEDLHHLYEFGKNLGIAFQVQDDYLDAFGDPDKFGKKKGGDIVANKKTFLLIKAQEVADNIQKRQLNSLLNSSDDDKVDQMLKLYRETGVDEWATTLQDEYMAKAVWHFEKIGCAKERKEPLAAMMNFLIERTH